MNAMPHLATTFVTSEAQEILCFAAPVAVMLFVSVLYLTTRHKLVAGVYYLMLFAILSINFRLASAGQWGSMFIPEWRDGNEFVPASRMQIWFVGRVAVDLAMLLALASPIITPFSRRSIRRVLRRSKERLPQAAPEAVPAAAPTTGLLKYPLIRKAEFPLILLSIWVILMFGHPQWCRILYIYQSIAGFSAPVPPPHYSGTWREYSLFGRLMREVTYDRGQYNGITIHWNDRGLKVKEYHYKNGVPHGLCIDWWSNGTPLQEFTDTHGVHDGRYRKWNEDGQLLTDCIYKDGTLWSGMFGKGITDVYENYGRRVMALDSYHRGIKHGPAKVWLDEYGKHGQVLAEGTRVSGAPWNGTILSFDFPKPDECRYWVRTYKLGRVDGPAWLYAARASYCQEQHGTRLALGPTTGDIAAIAQGDLAETMPGEEASKVVPTGSWKFRDTGTPAVILEGNFKDGKPWSGTFPRHGPRGSILDQCTFMNGEPRDGTYYVLDSPESESVIEYSYQGGKLVGPPAARVRAVTPLPVYLQN